MAVRKIAGQHSMSAALADVIDPAAPLVPHCLEEYEANLRKRLGGRSDVAAAAGELVKAILTTAVASMASSSFLVRGAAAMAANVAAEQVASMASPANADA